MPVVRKPSVLLSPFQVSWPSETTVIRTVLLVFFVLHVIAGALLHGHAATDAAEAEEARILLYD